MPRSLILAALAVTLSAAAAQAAPAPQMHVALADVNLSDASGRATAIARIHAAAAAVCGPVQYSLDVRGSEVIAARDSNARCIRRATQGAIGQLEAAGYAMTETANTRLAGN